MPNFADRVTHLGGVGVGEDYLSMNNGKVFFLDPLNGTDSNDGKTPDTAFKTLPVAYAELTANQHDRLYLIGNATAISLGAAFTWAKAYTHFIGVAAPVGYSSRARVTQTAGTTFATMFTINATGCIFKNIMFQQGVASTAALVCFAVTSSRNYFENCHFAGMVSASAGQTGGRCLKFTAGSENKFVNCTFGYTTAITATNYTVEFATGSTRNKFLFCDFISYVSTGGQAHAFVYCGTSGLDRHTIFQNCNFINDGAPSGGLVQNQAFVMQSTNIGGVLLLNDCSSVGVTKWETTASGFVKIDKGAVVAASSGLAVNPA